MAEIDDRRSYRGHRMVTLRNEHLELDVLPALGAKVFNFVHRKAGTNLLWHNPTIEPDAVPFGANYDDNFSGGWDELFPNDAPGLVGSAEYPDHGELWCQPWDYALERADASEVTLYLRRAGTATTTVVEKWITLRQDDWHVRFRHKITNTGLKPLDFLWKLHPALNIEGGDRLDIPAATAELVDPAFGRIAAPQRFPWPVAQVPGKAAIDFSLLPPAGAGKDFLYLLDLKAGWCALRRMRLGVGLGLAFPREIFTSVWLFMTYGGWRGLHTLVLEPCTTYPKDLNAAIRAGTCSHLAPGASLHADVTAVLFEGTAPVTAIDADGRVTH